MLKTIVNHVKYKQRVVNTNIKVVMKNSNDIYHFANRSVNLLSFSTDASVTASGVKNPNIFGVGGPGTKRPGVRRKRHLKRMRMRFAKTKQHHKVSQQQQKIARAKRLEKIRAKQQWFKDIGMTKKEFLG